ncbi:MAG: peptidoglycan-associated lipoprotein Pal [Gammaproteobacteria bacterium]|jgi:peptidoglycan-associated lipoprotein
MSLRKIALVIAGTMVLAACTPTTEPEAPGDGREPIGGQDGGLVTQPLPDDGSFVDGQPVGGGVGLGEGDEAGLVGHTIIYFDFDSAAIRPEYAESVAAHAANLVENPGIVIRLEGHTDERGSREYNIGLGERRAQAVRQALMLQGVSASQLSTVSYGEERPAITGEDEEAWAMNRRVEIVYLR